MKPIRLKMKNFFSHKNSDIDLTDINSCLLVGNIEGDHSKSNGSGKSAIFEAIPWVLFNNSRSSSRNDNIRWGQSSCKVDLTFSHKGDVYRVSRERFRKTSTSNVYFFRENSIGEWTDLTKETATETNKHIVSVLGMDYKTFLNTVYFRQNDISEFSEADPGRKKEIIKNIVDISRWDDYEKASKEKLKEFKIKHSIIMEDMESFELIESDYNNTKKALEEERGRLSSVKSIRSKYVKNYENMLEEYLIKESSLDTNLFDKTLEKIRYFSDMIVKNENIIKKESTSLDSIKSKHLKTTEYCDSLSRQIDSFVEEKDLDLKIEEISSAIMEAKSEYKFKSNSIFEIKNTEYSSDFCGQCKQPVSREHIDSLKRSNRVKEESLSKDIAKLKKSISSLKKEKEFYEINLKERAKVDLLKEKLSSATEKRDFYKNNLDSIDEFILLAKKRVSEFSIKKKEQDKLLGSLKDSEFSSLKEKLRASKEKKDEIQKEELSVIKCIGAYEQEVKNFEEKISDYKKKKKELIGLHRNIEIYSMMTKYFGKNGIQTILLNNFIEDLEDETNRVIKNIGLPFSISIETQTAGFKGNIKETLDIKIRKDGHYHGFESLSGGEKAKIALSLRFALSSLSSRYGGGEFEFIMLDEINSAMDRDGVDNLMVSIIDSLEKSLLVLMITHDEGLKENFSNILEVTKINGESHISMLKT